MKNTLTLIAAIALAVTATNAQQSFQTLQQQQQALVEKISILNRSANKTTGTASRLVHEMSLVFNGSIFTPLSTICTYEYSFERGYDNIHNDWAYDRKTYYSHRENKLYDNSNNRVIERVEESYDNPPGVWKPGSKHMYTYTAEGKIETEIVQYWDQGQYFNMAKTVNAYNEDGKLNEITEQELSNNIWNDKKRTLIFYNASGQATGFTYQEFGNTGWRDVQVIIYNYFKSNEVQVLYKFLYQAGWKTEGQEILTYDMHNDLVHKLLKYNSNGAFVDFEEYIYTNDKTHRRLSELARNKKNGSPYMTDWKKAEWTYNSDGTMNTATSKEWNVASGQWTNHEGTAYFYEPYTTGVADLETNKNNLLLFPCPAKNVLSVATELSSPQQMSVSIYDIMGRQVKTWNAAAAKHYTETIDIAMLPQGNYIIRLAGDKQQLTGRFVKAD